MKNILLLLPFFVSFVASQRSSIYCQNGKCPSGYTRSIQGPNLLNSVCLCYKDKILDSCKTAYANCIYDHSTCSSLLSKCTPAGLLERCDHAEVLLFPELCDKAAEMIRQDIEKKDGTQDLCDNALKECNSGDSHACAWAADVCHPNVALELCKQNKLTFRETCFEAEKRLERLKVQSTTYQCKHSQADCDEGHYCEGLVEFCDSETVARRCYKGDIRNKEACINAIQKSQYFMGMVDPNDCSQEVTKCERGDFDGCIKVPTVCSKEAVSALCKTKTIKNELICTYASVKSPSEPNYPGCGFFSQECQVSPANYAFCDLASRYCDDKTIDKLCDLGMIIDTSICDKFAFTYE